MQLHKTSILEEVFPKQEKGIYHDERRERNNGWERVRTRRERRATERVRAREGPYLTIAGKRNGQQHGYMRGNWRDCQDVASFYFTRFPDNATETDLWHHFKKMGNLQEIFISKKRNFLLK